MKRKLMVTGAQGFVAGSVLAQAGGEWEMHAISRGEAMAEAGRAAWHTCDPLRRDELERVFLQVQPKALIHSAAIADIDAAEQNQELAQAVNVEMTRTLVNLCRETGCRMIFCSTDNIFDGEQAPYHETDAAGPVNYYGRTKVEAEESVRTLGGTAVIARLAIVMGLPVMGSGNSFLARMIRSLRDRKVVIVPAKEVRTPVDVMTAGRALLELAAGNHGGIFHLAGNERLNRMEMAQRIAGRVGLDASLLKAQTPAEPAHRAPRPRDVSLDNARTCAELKTRMLDFEEALGLVLDG